MIYWLIIFAALIIIGILGIYIEKKKNEKTSYGISLDMWPTVLSIISFFVAAIILACCIVTFFGFNKFEYEIELRRAQYETLISDDYNPLFNDNVYIVEDIVSLNKELTGMKASRMYYNNWSLYPERVLDIRPIGLE